MKKTQTWHQNSGVVGLNHFDVSDLKSLCIYVNILHHIFPNPQFEF